MVEEGTFRQDLYFRINSFPIYMPALRERKEDIGLIAESLLYRLSPDKKFTLSEDAVEFLKNYPFLGNIRELRNMLERSILLADTDVLHMCHLIDESLEINSDLNLTGKQSHFYGVILPLAELESRYLQWAMGESDESKKELAAKLGLTQRTLYRKLIELKK
jgi:transcriptional regulator with PAS, ATPase and Fis domain